MKKKLLLSSLLAFSLFLLTSCGSIKGTYIYKGDISIISNATVTLKINGDKGKMKIEGNALGLLKAKHTENITVDQKKKTITSEDGNTTLTYKVEDDNIVITKDSSGTLTNTVFEKEK